MNCIIFEGALNHGGYGQLGTPKWGTRLAHRAVLAESLGRKLERYEFACHTCDTPSCVNIDHLYPGDHATNARDRKARGRNADQKANPPNLGRKFGESTKAKHREKMKSQYASGWVHPMLGRKHSEETKLKIKLGVRSHNLP